MYNQRDPLEHGSKAPCKALGTAAVAVAGERFHAGKLDVSKPMKSGDVVGLLVDLRRRAYAGHVSNPCCHEPVVTPSWWLYLYSPGWKSTIEIAGLQM